ncbi:lipopolysaccharide biosynthesis glycosyltransferase [Duganella sp. 1411]|jgi:lipopolysaccharide biosynthesis glycosyltransferase|uniref:glycosyltransferase family 8 protein n=1 Tax=Duganella sp. 1411 TaxID=2806572 RepID=UPI001AE5CE54|nr:glycosyltransferase family 8 protein [Duganella sp. 1411]MBP1205699.1 lipopolysaccharide biosynthesis glycosyltransferase [Duganella sp. 1411]
MPASIKPSAVHVAIIVDQNGICGAKNTIKSALLSSAQISINVIDIGITEAQAQELRGISPHITIADVPARFRSWLENFSLRGYPHVSKAAYTKLLMHRILADVNKLIYLDSDTLVIDDLGKLFEVDFGENHLGATWTATQVLAGKVRLGLQQRYFNSGVLLCDLEKWRKSNIEDEFLAWYQKNNHKMKFNDQEVLNGVFDKSNLEIGKKWNVSQREVFFESQELGIDVEDVGVLHFNGPIKYWHPAYGKEIKYNAGLFLKAKALLSDIGFELATI